MSKKFLIHTISASVRERKHWHHPSLLLLAPALPLVSQTVSISPATATLSLDSRRQFIHTISGTTNPNVTWAHHGVFGGNLAVGTISNSGLYIQPSKTPSPNTVTIRVASAANTTRLPEAVVTLRYSIRATSAIFTTDLNVGNSSSCCFFVQPPITTSISPTTATVRGGATRTFTATVRNTNTTTVDWLVNGIVAGNAATGAIDTSGFYNACVSYTIAERCLEQAGWGASRAEIFRVMEIGFDAWLNEQRNLANSVYTMPTPPTARSPSSTYRPSSSTTRCPRKSAHPAQGHHA